MGWRIPVMAFSACRRGSGMLEIMRDSRLGTHGGLALIFVLDCKVLGGRARSRWCGTPMVAAPPLPACAVVWRCC